MDLKLENLYIECEKCKGSGEYTETLSEGRMRSSRSGPCDACGGRGGQLTEAGKVIKRFLGVLKSKPYLY